MTCLPYWETSLSKEASLSKRMLKVRKGKGGEEGRERGDERT